MRFALFYLFPSSTTTNKRLRKRSFWRYYLRKGFKGISKGLRMYWLLHELNIVLTYWEISKFLNFKTVLLFWFLFLALAIKIVITNKETIINRTPLVLDFSYYLLSTLEDPWGIKHLRLYKRRLLTCKSLVGFTQIKKLEMQF